ncbi:hypothetical protein OO010_15125 [Flavobacteriaceae bacterium KMM 6898]|nr:hypothetical protein [Flavobacteriaceae bacterium KMM 6898]
MNYNLKNVLLFVGLAMLLVCCNSRKKDKVKNDRLPLDISQMSIAYNVLVNEEKDDYEVFTMNMDGNQKINVTNFPGVEWTYAAHGKNLYYISDKDAKKRNYYLYKSDYLGRGIEKVGNLRLADSWMDFRKNGTEIIVNPHSSVDSVFYIINLKGKILQRIKTGLPRSWDPIFVNNGTQVVFRGGTKKSKKEEGYKEELYLINEDGSSLTQLTHYPETDVSAPWYAYKAGPPNLHPTENFISYASFQSGKYSLYGVTLDGQKQWKLTDNELWEVYHDWSPDGKWLVTDVSDSEESHYDIALINWATKAMTILTDTTYRFQQSPNFVMKTN